jgi:hypothetical protein
MHVFSADWSTGVGDRDYDQNMIRRFVLSSVAIALICAISPIRGLAETPPPSVLSNTVGLSEPSCYRHGFLWLGKDCSARNLWRQIKPLLDTGNQNEVVRALSVVMGPFVMNDTKALVEQGVNAVCAAQGLNAFLKKSVNDKKMVARVSDLLQIAPIPRGPYKEYVKVLKKAANKLFSDVQAIGLQSRAEEAMLEISTCSVRSY